MPRYVPPTHPNLLTSPPSKDSMSFANMYYHTKQTITANLLKMRNIQPRTEAGQGWTLTLHSSLVESTSTSSASSATATNDDNDDAASETGSSTTLVTTTATTTSTLSSTSAKSTAASSNGSSAESAAARWHRDSLSTTALWRVAGLVCASWVVVLIL